MHLIRCFIDSSRSGQMTITMECVPVVINIYQKIMMRSALYIMRLESSSFKYSV